jgi:superfamily I DNA/RNA helicase/mRNA-degrading endonuclease RelE of RelBE toxin-antitoxin system
MSYTVEITDSFSKELIQVPKKISKKVSESYGTLRSKPKGPNDKIKKLQKWISLYRYRIGDYRFAFHVCDQKKAVKLIALAKREKFYEKIGHNPKLEKPTQRIVADVNLHDLLEEKPSPQEIQEAQTQEANHEEIGKFKGDPEKPLPHRITINLLRDMDIPQNQMGPLVNCNNEQDLLSLEDSGDISGETIEKVVEELYPRRIEEVLDDPRRVIPDESSLQDLANGGRSLESFLLALDEDQKPLTDRFKGDSPQGPWIVKGGPGSGKSTVALYCIKNILHENNQTLQMSVQPLKILFVTYTRTLVKFSQYLLKALEVNRDRQQVDVINVDRLVSASLPANWNKTPISDLLDPLVKDHFYAALNSSRSAFPDFNFTGNDHKFLLEEIESVITGNELNEEAEYLVENRKGRRRPLNQNQRMQLWKFYTEIQPRLDSANLCLWQGRIRKAKENSSKSHQYESYDYVFIDEAQDLNPIAIKFCVSLAKASNNVFLTADRNQSIYGSSFSWSRVSESLNFRGRSTIFRKNYRTTQNIVDAVRPLLSVDADHDKETIDDKPVKLGADPQLTLVSSIEEEIDTISEWLSKVRLSENIGYDSTAILCPTKWHCEEIVERLPKKFNARFFNRDSEEFRHTGTTLMTMHSAKGLQYPAVAVLGLTEGQMPWHARGGEHPIELNHKLRRLFYVACTRSMSRLLVIGGKNNPSSFIQELDLDYWES